MHGGLLPLSDLSLYTHSQHTVNTGLDRRSSSTPAYGEVEPLLKALHVLPLSRAVQHSVLPVAGWSGSVELDPIVAECLLALQRFLIHHMPALYHAVQDTVTPLLLNLRSVSILAVVTNVCLAVL